MPATVRSAAIVGIDVVPVDVEAEEPATVKSAAIVGLDTVPVDGSYHLPYAVING